MTDAEARQAIKSLLAEHDVAEARFLSGTGFFVSGRLVVAVVKEGLCARLADLDDEEHLGAPLEFAGRPVAGWTTLTLDQLDSELLERWVLACLRHGSVD